MLDYILTAIPIGVSLSFLIGPVFFVLLETSVTKGFRAALVLDLGVIVADILFIALSYFSSYRLLESIGKHPGLYFLGGFILFIYGLATVLKRSKEKKAVSYNVQPPLKKNKYLRLFIKGFLLNFINIGVLIFWLGLLVIFGSDMNMQPGRIFIFFGLIVISYFVVDIAKILLAKQLKNKLTPKLISKIESGMGILLMVFGIGIAVKGFIPKDKLNIDSVIEEIKNN